MLKTDILFLSSNQWIQCSSWILVTNFDLCSGSKHLLFIYIVGVSGVKYIMYILVIKYFDPKNKFNVWF